MKGEEMILQAFSPAQYVGTQMKYQSDDENPTFQ